MGAGWKNPLKEEKANKKGQVISKIAREISVAAKLGGPDPEGNARLKLAIIEARAVSCPRDTIERAIKKGAGLLEGEKAIEELTYEGSGPYGVGVIVECQTDNKNRTVSELRRIFTHHKGSLGETNSASWKFDRVSVVTGKKAAVGDPDEEAIEVNANSVEKNADGTYSFFGSPTDLDSMRTALIGRGWEVTGAERSYVAKNKTDLNQEQLKEIHELLQEIEDFDDTHRIHATI